MSRRKFSNEFKREAVNLVLDGGQKASEVARDLGMNEQTLRNWLAREREGMLDPSSPQRAEHEEVKRLRKEVAKLKREKEILGKATAYFAKLHQ